MRTALPAAVRQSLRERGRAWDRQNERCVTCRYWSGALTDEIWRGCEHHKTLTRDDGGCAMHLAAEREATQRKIEIMAMRVQGATYRQVGAAFRISRQRAHQICATYDKA